jgi:hypothetical protein
MLHESFSSPKPVAKAELDQTKNTLIRQLALSRTSIDSMAALILTWHIMIYRWIFPQLPHGTCDRQPRSRSRRHSKGVFEGISCRLSPGRFPKSLGNDQASDNVPSARVWVLRHHATWNSDKTSDDVHRGALAHGEWVERRNEGCRHDLSCL